jgi:hypothetical protein
VADINDWGATFTTTSTVEVNATGTSLRTVTRVGKFCNLAELLVLSSIYTDVVTRDEVPIALPQLADGQRRIMSIAPPQTARRCCRARCSGGVPACNGADVLSQFSCGTTVALPTVPQTD